MSGVILEFFVLGMVAMIILMAFLQCCISCARKRGKKGKKPLGVNVEEGIIQEAAMKEKKIKGKSQLKNDFLTQLRKTTLDE